MRGLDGLALGIGKERMSVHATRIAAGSASADPGHVHTAVCSTVASWLVSLVTRFRASRGTQPTPACRLVVPGACKRLAYIFPGFVFLGLRAKRCKPFRRGLRF